MYCRRCLYELDEVEDIRCPTCGRRFDPGRPRSYRAGLPRHPSLRNLFRHLVRAIVVVAIVLAVTAGWLCFRYAAERRAMTRIVELGGQYEARPREAEPAWLKEWARKRDLPIFDAVHVVDLHGTPATDRDLRYLKRCSELVELNLRATSISDRGLRRLKALTRLERLHLGGTNVTPEGVEKLKQALPECEVSWP